MTDPRIPSVNRRVADRLAAMMRDAPALRIAVATGEAGETIVDCGAAVAGSLEAGRLMAEICMGGLGQVAIGSVSGSARWPFGLTVRSSAPVIACLGSQYAGWMIRGDEAAGEPGYFAMGSGPARALAGREDVLVDIGYRDTADAGTLVLETDTPPPAAIVRRIARDCGLDASALTILIAPTTSLAGTVQIVARVVEVALHKAHETRFDLSRIVEGLGTAPLAPPPPDFVTAMGRTNDAVIYGGRVMLHVTGPAAEAKALAEALPSSGAADFGRPFAEIFRRYEGDFYKIDGALFSPAEVQVVALETGETFGAGAIDPELVDASFNG